MTKMTSYAPGTPSWVDLGSPDPEASAAFYGALFGWQIEEGPEEAGGYRICMLGGARAAGLGPQMQPGIPPYWNTYMSVSDADAAVAQVTAAGGQVLAPPMDVMDVGRMAVLADSGGAAFSVWQPKNHIGAEIVNEPGAFTWTELSTRDPEGAKAFYPKVFGWGTESNSMGDMGEYTEFKIDGRSIAGMMQMPPTMPAAVPAFWLVYFAVADTDAAVAKAGELGGSLMMGPVDIPIGRFAVITDPHGASFGVITLAG